MVIATYFADNIKSLCLFVKTHREEVGALKVHIEEAERKGVADITKNNKHTLITVKKKQVNLLKVIMRIHRFGLSH